MVAIYWYKITPKDDMSSSLPTNQLHSYKIQVKGIDVMPPLDQVMLAWYKERDTIWVKNPP